MKCLAKSLCIILVIIATMFVIAYSRPHLVARAIKSLTEYSLSNKIMSVKIGDVELSEDLITLKSITLSNTTLKVADIEKVEISYSLEKLFTKRELFCHAKVSNFAMDEIKFDATGDIEYSMSHKKVDNLKMDFVGGGFVIFSANYETSFGSPYSLSMNGKIVELPLMLHKAFWSLAPENGVVIFLKDYISNGYVSGQWDIKLDKDFFAGGSVKPDSLVGKFTAREMALRYDVEYPVLQNIKANVDMTGTKLQFNITHGYSGKVSLYDGVVDLDWEKGENSEVIVKTKGNGPALDLIEFIPRESVEDLKKMGIDLTKVGGQINLDFGMNIPLNPAIPNSFDVKVDIKDMGLKLFEDAVELSNAALKGSFDGKVISLMGNGKVNGFDSDLSYQFVLGEPAEVENILGIKLKFAPTEDMKKSNFSVVSGKSIININYKSKGDQGKFEVNSNLTDVEFFAEKLGLRKEAGKKAILSITSSGEELNPSRLDIKVTGDDNLQILGSVKLGDKERVVNISKFQHLDTDVKAQITTSPSSLKAVISGAKLNLSNAGMASFLEKDSDSRDTDLQINIAAIKMKNNIWISNFVMNIRCDKVKCYEGEMDSNIGTQSFRMRLSHQDNAEQWEIISTNAGALFKALGMYDNMKAGSLMLLINTSRKEVKVGETIPVMKGHFALKKFVTTDTPILTRMVSFTSLAGVMGAIRGNKDIRFAEMSGDFSFKNEVIKIKNSDARGAYFDFTMSGLIDTKNHMVKLKGNITPEYYFISAIARRIPAIGSLFGGSGHRRGILSPPYSINSKY